MHVYRTDLYVLKTHRLSSNGPSGSAAVKMGVAAAIARLRSNVDKKIQIIALVALLRKTSSANALERLNLVENPGGTEVANYSR